MTSVNRYIGAPIERVEDLRFLRGRGEYVADLAREEMLHAAILRSPVAHGRIRAVDAGQALAIGGVRAVITAAEIGIVPKIPLRLQSSPATEPFRQPVMGAAKVPFFNRRTVAAMMGLPESAVDLIENDVGGGFGARGEFYPEDFLIPFAARHVGRPVMWIEDRREHLIAMNHARQMDCEVEIACKRDGTILGLRGDIFVDLGAYIRTNGLTAPRNVAQFFSGPYRIPNIGLRSSALVTNKTPTGTYRAPGRYEGSFFCERLIELAAKDLGIDGVVMRRCNLVCDAEMPYPLARIDPGDLYTQTECDSGDYAHALDRCLAEFDWEQKRKLQGRLIDGRYHGVAVA